MNDSIIVYSSPTCPKCRMLKQQLTEAGIFFTVCEDVEIALSKGISTLPMLEVNQELMNLSDALKWIRSKSC
jgi:glutaredoxin